MATNTLINADPKNTLWFSCAFPFYLRTVTKETPEQWKHTLNEPEINDSYQFRCYLPYAMSDAFIWFMCVWVEMFFSLSFQDFNFSRWRCLLWHFDAATDVANIVTAAAAADVVYFVCCACLIDGNVSKCKQFRCELLYWINTLYWQLVFDCCNHKIKSSHIKSNWVRMLFELCLVAVWCRCSISMRMECTILYKLFFGFRFLSTCNISNKCRLLVWRRNWNCHDCYWSSHFGNWWGVFS